MKPGPSGADAESKDCLKTVPILRFGGRGPLPIAYRHGYKKESRVKNRSKRAFTLIELIIVIVVLGILATIAIVGYKAVIDRTNQSSAISAAQSFDRQLRSMAGYGDSVNNNPNDNDPRKPELLLEMVYKGDIPDEFVATTALKNNSLRVLVWQPGGLNAAKFTRLFCSTGQTAAPCSGMDYSASSLSLNSGTAGSITLVAGHLLNPTRSNPAGSANPNPICIQFHKAGQDAYLGVSSSANTAGIVSSAVDTACPSATYGGAAAAVPSVSTGAYTDISATAAAGTANTDATW